MQQNIDYDQLVDVVEKNFSCKSCSYKNVEVMKQKMMNMFHKQILHSKISDMLKHEILQDVKAHAKDV